MSSALIHLPVLFEVSGNTMVIGEKPLTETSYYNYRHQFTCGGGTASTTATLLKNQFKYIDEIQNYTVTRSGGSLLVNGSNQELQLGFNVKYRFDVGDSSMSGQTLKFSTTSNGTHGAGVTQQEFIVKVVDDSGTKKFSIDGVNLADINVRKASTYIFDLKDPSLYGYTFTFSATNNGTHASGTAYTTGVTVTGVAGTTGAKLTWVVDAGAAANYYYYAPEVSGMGGTVNVSGNTTGTEYTTGITANGTPGTSGSFIDIIIPNTVQTLFYYNGASIGSGDNGEGNKISIEASIPLFTLGAASDKAALVTGLHGDLCNDGTANLKHDATHSKVKKKNNEDYAEAITGASGHTLGEVLLRYTSTHLSGHPLGQAMIKNDTVFKNQIDGQTANDCDVANRLINKLCDGLVESGTEGKRSEILQSMFEQMIAADITRFSGVDDVTSPKSIPFVAGDVLTLYVKMRSKLLNDAVSNAAFQAILNQIFPASMFVYMNDSDGILDAGIWRIDLTIS
jgi:hypothetical protein